MKFYKHRKYKHLVVAIPYRYHIEKYSESSYEWFQVAQFISYRNAKIEFDRLKETYPSLHFRLNSTLEIS